MRFSFVFENCLRSKTELWGQRKLEDRFVSRIAKLMPQLLRVMPAGLSLIVILGCQSKIRTQGSLADPSLSISLSQGAGRLELPGLPGAERRTVTLHYYMPVGFDETGPILFVMHGAGRNGDDYRDSWIELADQYRVLILAPTYSEDHYPGTRSYHLGNMRTWLGVWRDRSTWSYGSLERVFDLVVEATGSAQTAYDVFGHSAGAQFVHRLCLFQPYARIHRAVAANAGWYTGPTFTERFPYGLRGSPISNQELESAFAHRLIVLLGELDNSRHAGGHLRTTRQALRQGENRFDRGRWFMNTAQREAAIRGIDLQWELQVAPGIGHSYRGMAKPAAKLLYGKTKE